VILLLFFGDPLETIMKKALIAVAAVVGMSFAVQVQAADVAATYNKACVACHGTGVMGAPKKGDKAAWAPRLKQGVPTLVGHVKNGFKAMPPKGLCADCTDADYTALIKYMSN
jgi:cytochrome c5